MPALRKYLFLPASVLLLLAGCEHADPVDPMEDDELQPTLSSIQEHVFNQSCALSGCHQGTNAPVGLDLSTGNAHANLVDVRSGEVPDLFLVEPGNPDDSYLIIKLEGSSRMAVGTVQMPFGRDPLSSETIAVVRRWITNGAPDN